jgi:hypothetical protein
MALSYFYGYRFKKKGEKRFVVLKEAEVVRKIFADYINGMSFSYIAKKLNDSGITTLNGGKWRPYTVSKIVRNEKYAGTDMCEAIINADTLELARAETAKRKHPFIGLIKCKHCNAPYVYWPINSGTPHQSIAWKCTVSARKGKKACPSRQIQEDVLATKIAEALKIDVFNPKVFLEKVTEVIIYTDNLSDNLDITLTLADGNIIYLAANYPLKRDNPGKFNI